MDDERWRPPSAGHTHGTAWLLDSTTELRKSSQRHKLEEFLTHIQVSGDPTDENGQLDRVLCIGALVKSEGEGNEGRDVGLQRVVNVVRHLRCDDERYGTKRSRSQRQNAAQDELGFRGPDCFVFAEHGGGPDARPSWAGSGPRAGGCPPMTYATSRTFFLRLAHDSEKIRS